MRITPGGSTPLPLNIAKAYGVKPTPIARPAGQPVVSRNDDPQSSTVASIAPAAVDAYQRSSGISQLVAGTVNQPVNFDGAAASDGSLRMYTRAADRIEAALGVQLGRSLDVKG
jgi:hypothetical protein